MAREDRSQTGAKEGVARDVEGVRGAPKGDESYRSHVGLESVAELDAERLEQDVGVGEPGADRSVERPAPTGRSALGMGTSTRPVHAREAPGELYTGDRDERIETREPGSVPEPSVEVRADRAAESRSEEQRGDESVMVPLANPSRAHSPPTRDARTSGGRSSGARGKGGGGRHRPSDEGASATSGRSGSARAAKHAGQHQMNATVRGAASSGEQRGATTGPRKGTRTAANATRGTSKAGIRRGSSKSRSARRAGLH